MYASCDAHGQLIPYGARPGDHTGRKEPETPGSSQTADPSAPSTWFTGTESERIGALRKPLVSTDQRGQ